MMSNDKTPTVPETATRPDGIQPATTGADKETLSDADLDAVSGGKPLPKHSDWLRLG